MNTQDLRKKSIVELEKELKAKVEALHNFRLGISKSKIKNVKHGKDLKREVARILTLVKEAKKA